MTKRKPVHLVSKRVMQEGADALLRATLKFLRSNNISEKFIIDAVRRNLRGQHRGKNARQYKSLVRAYEEMGMVMSTWYSTPRFLDKGGKPLPLSTNRSQLSISAVLRLSRVKISQAAAVNLLRRSPSIKIDSKGRCCALKRVFILPEFEVPRAALVVERYLETLRQNALMSKTETALLLERSCHVSEIDLKKIAPVLRDIKERGASFMDSVDGDIEGHRLRRPNRKDAGDMGVFVFAWTRPARAPRPSGAER